MIIFKYLEQKDVFLKFYSKYLAKRLIGATSNSDDHEASIISGMKETCGFEFTSKLQRMFNDITLCEQLSQSFQDYCSNTTVSIPIQPKNLTTFVLTQGSWPLQIAKNTTFTVPIQIQQCIDTFKNFYFSTYTGRKLSYIHSLCKGNVKTHFLNKSYEVTASDFQLSVLFLFNEKDILPWSELQAGTNLKENDLQRTLTVKIKQIKQIKQNKNKNKIKT